MHQKTAAPLWYSGLIHTTWIQSWRKNRHPQIYGQSTKLLVWTFILFKFNKLTYSVLLLFAKVEFSDSLKVSVHPQDVIQAATISVRNDGADLYGGFVLCQTI